LNFPNNNILIIKFYILKEYIIYNYNSFFWGLGIGDWGLGIGDWGLGPIPNPQSPIPIKNRRLHNKIIN